MSLLPPDLARVRDEIVSCERCVRLRQYCRRIAQDKRAAYRDETYWGRPVPGFGDPSARVLVVGLAPAAHGANRTGRVFTGDGVGGSGDFLFAAMHAAGFASQKTSHVADDGLTLTDAWIAAAVRCAPPDNKPTPAEFAACHSHLRAEVDALPHLRVFVALGKLAFDTCWKLLRAQGLHPDTRPAFAHGATYRATANLEPRQSVLLIASYHPSRQNTHTGRLTATMLKQVFMSAKREAARP